MLASFLRFDSALIERVFQPLADALSDHVGLDRLPIARFCLDAASVAWIVSRAGSLSAAVTRWDPGAACLRMLLLLLGLAALRSLHTAFRRLGRSRGANPLRILMLPHRGVVLALLAADLALPGGVGGLADLAMLACFGCALYFGACVSRPQVRRRSPHMAASGAG